MTLCQICFGFGCLIAALTLSYSTFSVSLVSAVRKLKARTSYHVVPSYTLW